MIAVIEGENLACILQSLE